MDRIGRYFRVHEFDCHDGTPYPDAWITTRLLRLAATLDAIRDAWGGPLLVVSGYRSKGWNLRVGGASGSYHMQGMAADVRPQPDPSVAYAERVESLHHCALGLWNTGQLPELGGVGYYPARWIHVDVRGREPIGHLAEWVGGGVGSERTA